MPAGERAVVEVDEAEKIITRYSNGKTLARGAPCGEEGYLRWRVGGPEKCQALMLPADDDLTPGSRSYMALLGAIEAVWGITVHLRHKYEIAEAVSPRFRVVLAPFKALLGINER